MNNLITEKESIIWAVVVIFNLNIYQMNMTNGRMRN